MKYSVGLVLALILVSGCSDRNKPLPDPIAPNGGSSTAATDGGTVGPTGMVMIKPPVAAPMVVMAEQAGRDVDRLAQNQAEMMQAANEIPGQRKEALKITVYKSATCGCCQAWIKHLESDGFLVISSNQENMTPTKDRLGVPANKRSCHTGEIDGMFVEGHVPAEDIRKMVKLKKEGKAPKGIAVPGMPAGSPGMEMGDRHDKYDVFAISSSNQESVFSSH